LAYSQTSACASGGALIECPRFGGHNINAQVTRSQDLLDAGISIAELSTAYRSDLGGQAQNGYRVLDAWWWPSVAADLPWGVSRIDWQPEVFAREDSSGRVMEQYLLLGSQFSFQSGPVLALKLAPLAKQRLGADQSLIATRSLNASLKFSPSTLWQKSWIGLTVGELADYFNARAGHGYSVSTDQVLALSRALSLHLNGSWNSKRATNATVSGPTIREGVALLTANYQYQSFSRLRWATQWQRYLGRDLAATPASAFSGSNVAHTLSWIHEPRIGLGYSINLSHQASQDNAVPRSISLLTLKAGYAFW
jgi:hypothetical protein